MEVKNKDIEKICSCNIGILNGQIKLKGYLEGVKKKLLKSKRK